jgi:hypothetical protein
MFRDNEIFRPVLEAAEPVIDIAPRLLAFAAIMIVGLLLAYLARRAALFVLRVAGFDVLSYRIGLTALVTKAWYDRTPRDIAARSIYWIVLLFHFLIAVFVLHVDTLNRIVSAVIAFIPLLIIAAFIFILGYLCSRFIGRATLIALVNAQSSAANIVAMLVRGAVLIFFAAMAAEYLGVARGIVVTSFAILLGGVVLALAIAFGIGGKEVAKDILEERIRSLSGKKSDIDELTHI